MLESCHRPENSKFKSVQQRIGSELDVSHSPWPERNHACTALAYPKSELEVLKILISIRLLCGSPSHNIKLE